MFERSDKKKVRIIGLRIRKSGYVEGANRYNLYVNTKYISSYQYQNHSIRKQKTTYTVDSLQNTLVSIQSPSNGYASEFNLHLLNCWAKMVSLSEPNTSKYPDVLLWWRSLSQSRFHGKSCRNYFSSAAFIVSAGGFPKKMRKLPIFHHPIILLPKSLENTRNSLRSHGPMVGLPDGSSQICTSVTNKEITNQQGPVAFSIVFSPPARWGLLDFIRAVVLLLLVD